MTLDPVVHEKARLQIMSALASLNAEDKVDFTFLKKLLNMTDGNLSTHLRVLEKEGYIEINKSFVGRKPKTIYWLTRKGRQAFSDYVKALENILSQHLQ